MAHNPRIMRHDLLFRAVDARTTKMEASGALYSQFGRFTSLPSVDASKVCVLLYGD